jgi:hypothetical protein
LTNEVTGVQTCALPIFESEVKASLAAPSPVRNNPHVSILILKNVNGKGGVSV